MIEYLIIFGIALLSIGLAGIASSRHLIIMLMSIEIILVGASLVAIAFFTYYSGSAILPLLFTIWAVAASEVIMLISFYRYMAKGEFSLDITKLSELKD